MSAVLRCLLLCLHLDFYQAAPLTDVNSDADSVAQLMSNIRGSWGPPVPYLEKRGYMDYDQRQPYNYARLYQSKEDFLRSLYPNKFAHRRSDYGLQPMSADNRGIDQPSFEEWNQLENYLEDPYIGESLFKKIKQKWNNFWKHESENATTTARPPAPTTTVPTTTTIKPKVPANAFFPVYRQPVDFGRPWIRNIDNYDDTHERQSKSLDSNITELPATTASPSILPNPSDTAATVPIPDNISKDQNILPDNTTISSDPVIPPDNGQSDHKPLPEKLPQSSQSPNSVVMPDIQQTDLDYMRKYVNCANPVKATFSNGNSSTQKYLDNKLKFLANIHHSVSNVGVVRPDQRLDLNAVQNQIDDARMTYNINEHTKSDQNKISTDRNKKNVPPTQHQQADSPWWPLGVQISKRSVSSGPEITYHNDYLDSSDASENDSPNDSDNSDYDDSDDIGPDSSIRPEDDTANLFGWFRRHKHKKHRRKHHKYRFWKKHHSELTDLDRQKHADLSADKNAPAYSSNLNGRKHDEVRSAVKTKPSGKGDDFADFSDIQNRLHPEQQKDIDMFIRNTKAAPERFDFDVDSFVAKYTPAVKPNEISIQSEAPTERRFFEFESDKPLSPSDKPILDNRRHRRDILTQHLKAIANKIHLYPNSNDDPFAWTNQIVHNDVVPLDNVANTGNTGDDEDNRIIDSFYLLNDGKTVAESMPKKMSLISQLNLDLELDRKFRDLNSSKDQTYYAVEEEREMNANKESY